MSRHRLLEILSDRATELGVDVRYECPVSGAADEFADADLVLAADGVQSQLRRQFADEFGTTIEHGRNHYVWLGTTKRFTEFTYAFEQTAAGWIWFYAYPFDGARSTVIAECGPSTWQGLGFDRLDPDESVGELERIFARHLDGHPLLLQARQDSGVVAEVRLDQQSLVGAPQRRAGRRCRAHRTLFHWRRYQTGDRRCGGAGPSTAATRRDIAMRCRRARGLPG